MILMTKVGLLQCNKILLLLVVFIVVGLLENDVNCHKMLQCITKSKKF